jgi:hypothetical protein
MKPLLSRTFDRARSTYREAAVVQRETALELSTGVHPGHYLRILEIGCGGGFLHEVLRRRGVQGTYLALDIARAMLGMLSDKGDPACTSSMPTGNPARFGRAASTCSSVRRPCSGSTGLKIPSRASRPAQARRQVRLRHFRRRDASGTRRGKPRNRLRLGPPTATLLALHRHPGALARNLLHEIRARADPAPGLRPFRPAAPQGHRRWSHRNQAGLFPTNLPLVHRVLRVQIRCGRPRTRNLPPALPPRDAKALSVTIPLAACVLPTPPWTPARPPPSFLLHRGWRLRAGGGCMSEDPSGPWENLGRSNPVHMEIRQI